ncbi:MAG: FtsX-like permease family protein [Thermodesulfobacteriota bacterium]|nr:FtsX-like permease family protein [Thermodesulfobacteriota bacterium]
MRTLTRKLLRDAASMWGQALAIAVVVAGGVAVYVMSAGTLDILRESRALYYRSHRFAQVFADLKRAPESLAGRIADIPGVNVVETRVLAPANIEMPGFPDPITARIQSIPDGDQPLLNRLHLRQGRLPDPTRDNEILAGDSFAEAHGLAPGHALTAVINGRKRRLVITGIALSPEHIIQVAPGTTLPDFKRYGIFWTGRRALGAAYNMEGAFNSLVLTLERGANEQEVLKRLDVLLTPYGGLGAIGREDQMSHRYLSEEFRQLRQMAILYPVIFMGVALFLLNIVLGRLIGTQREQIAALKAFGYSNFAVGLHYAQLALFFTALGTAGGIGAGLWMGGKLTALYQDFYRFPELTGALRPQVALTAFGLSLAAALAGTIRAVRRAALLPPAEAMRPEPPARYRVSILERLGLGRLFSQPDRMIVRNLERRPVKAALGVLGIAMACAVLMVGMFFGDAVDEMMRRQYFETSREDLSVAFTDPTSAAALYELLALPGVRGGEPYRTVPVRLGNGRRSYRTRIQGLAPGAELHRLVDTRGEAVPIPNHGLLLTDFLASEILGVVPGETVIVEALEGGRPVREVRVAGVVSEYLGVSGYMALPALNRMMREGHAVSGAYLATDPAHEAFLYAELNERPRVAGATARLNAIRSHKETMDRQMLVFGFFATLLAGAIAFGVVYNSARIALAERARELASLRVLGYTRGEVAYILLGEMAVLTAAAIPVGFVLGRTLCALVIRGVQTDIFRIPLVLTPSTYAFSAAVVLAASLVSALIVARRLAGLDLVGVLKTKE